MSVYLVVALVADLNTLSSIDPQIYQTSDAFATEVANHFSSFLALTTHKKGVFHATKGRNTPTKKAQKGSYRRLFMRGCFCVQAFSSVMALCLSGNCYLLTLSLAL